MPPKIRELIADLQAGSSEGLHVGSSPGLIYGGCHGDDEKAVFDELCQIVEDAIELYRRGRALPRATSGRDFANKMQDVA